MPVAGLCSGLAAHRVLVTDRVTRVGAPLPWVALRHRGGPPPPREASCAWARAPPVGVRIVIDELAPPRLGWHASPGWSPGASRPASETVGASYAHVSATAVENLRPHTLEAIAVSDDRSACICSDSNATVKSEAAPTIRPAPVAGRPAQDPPRS